MAMKAAAVPPVEPRNCRRLMPSFFAAPSASSFSLASTFFWLSLCGGGMYSPFETTRVGTGDGKSGSSASYARVHFASCSSLSKVWSSCQVPPVSFHSLDPGMTRLLLTYTGAADARPCAELVAGQSGRSRGGPYAPTRAGVNAHRVEE